MAQPWTIDKELFMKVFRRVRDIVSSNLNHALDKMEDPKKMIRLMIDEMGDTIAEAKASLAASMATQKRCESEEKALGESVARWENRASMAVERGMDELAREALAEKKALVRRLDAKREEIQIIKGIIESKNEQIHKLEEKLAEMKAKSSTMVERAAFAEEKIKSEKQLHEADGADAIRKFQEFENRVQRLEAEAEMAGFSGKTSSEKKFTDMERDEEVEKELAALKAKRKAASKPVSAASAATAAPSAGSKADK